jgi:hypothetical protein
VLPVFDFGDDAWNSGKHRVTMSTWTRSQSAEDTREKEEKGLDHGQPP